MRDASLNDFLDDESEESKAESTEGASADGEQRERDDEVVAHDDPARPTSTFDPAGGSCESCHTVVERLWRDGDAQVCDDCKEW